MAFWAALPIIGKVVEKAISVVDKYIPDKDLAAKLNAEIQSQLQTLDYSQLEKEIQAKAQIIVAEAQGHSWLQRNWRPITMLVFVYIIFHNYILAPIVQMFYPAMVVLEVPPDLWALIKIGIGGYIFGRSAERAVKEWKK